MNVFIVSSSVDVLLIWKVIKNIPTKYNKYNINEIILPYLYFSKNKVTINPNRVPITIGRAGISIVNINEDNKY